MNTAADIWNEICFLLNQNIPMSIAENYFENQVVRAIECLGWKESKGEITRQKRLPVGNNNYIQPDLIICYKGEYLIPIENKSPSKDLEKPETVSQIRSYMLQLKRNIGFVIGSELKVYYEGAADKNPFLLMAVPFVSNLDKGIEFVSNFNKESLLNKKYISYLEDKISKRDKEMEIDNIFDFLASEEIRQKIVEFLRSEMANFNNEVVSEVMDILSISITRKQGSFEDANVESANKPFITGNEVSVNGITRKSFKDVKGDLLFCVYTVLYFLKRRYSWTMATEETAKLLSMTSGIAVARKCGKDFGGGPNKGGGVEAFKSWFHNGKILDRLRERFPNLHDDDYNIFKDLLG